MNALRIGIVEDNLVIAEAIADMLAECGYTITGPAKRYNEAIAMIERDAPDLLLLDITLLGERDGIEVARELQRRGIGIPCIFLTSNTDFETIRRAREVRPAAFLAKPATKAQLYAAIEIALDHFSQRGERQQATPPGPAPETAGIYVKQGTAFRYILFTDVLFAESRDNYLRLVMQRGEETMIRSTLADFLERMPGFIQTHRAYAVALDKVAGTMPDQVLAGPYQVPLSRTYRPALLKALGRL